ncbi:Nucleotide-binding, alpha-beta plait [Artemisia annua]|uniref:Nucleotide-binding, alpha-beta plait n=1 Tax=Artemisia annua TaxID=35608 RepID=A0A2U1PK29_ARTAN|nr:Nucleotide-binding, alpha-beta plait [Artemisia annua]
MADPYWRYAADRGSGPPPTYPGYIPSEPSTLSSQPLWTSHNHVSSSSDFLQNDILSSRPRPYGVDDYMGIRRPETGISGYAAGTSRNGHPPVWEDPYPLGRRDVMQGIRPEIPDIVNERPASLRMADGPPVGVRESNVLFVDALPSDCSRREVSHLFRPFLGFQELRLVHKEPRHGADRGLVLCFVEFSDSKHALTALEALQGYKFDNKKPDSPALKIQFAHFPFQLPPDREEQRHANSFQLPSNREDQGRLTPRREPSIEDEEPRGRKQFEKRKFEGSPQTSKKRKNVESTADSSDSRKGRSFCIKCNRRHFGECKADLKGCFSCGKLDHKSWDCPSESAKACFNCGKSDHKSKDCRNKLCHGCKEPGHLAAECPKLNFNGSKREKKGNASEPMVKDEPQKT